MPQLDLAMVLLVSIGLAVAVILAVLAGTVTARVFFSATRSEPEEKRP